MTRRLLAFFAAELVMLIGCSDSPSRYHNHGTPGDGHFTPKPQIFAIDLEADPSAKKSKPKPKPTGNTDTDITPDGVGHPEYDPQTGGFPKESNIRIEHNPPSRAFPRSNPRPRNGECPVCGTMAKPYDVPIGPYSWRIESRRIDCVHCNVTFRQWAEGKEPKR